MKKLIYFTLGNNTNYIKLADLCIKSLYENDYDGDFLFITNLKNELLNQINFKNEPFFLELTQSNLLESSSNKLKIFKFDRIKEYEKIIYSDLDILWTKNPKILFDIIDDGYFYMSNEPHLMSETWWGGDILSIDEKKIILEQQINGLNAGIFGFKNDMVLHIQNIDTFLNENLNLVNTCLEQPFINVYVFRNKLYKTDFNNYVSHLGYNIENFDGVVLHFAGGPGNFEIKYEKMINYFNKKFV
jgi:hypothetical protein